MTYVVHLWEEAAPASLQDADRLHTRLAGTRAAANPKFAQLARALIERFPAEVGGRGGAGADWVESPPDGRTDTRVYSLGLYEEGIIRLLPVLVEVAAGLGLTVYDDQAGQVFLPGGWVVDEQGRHVLSPAPAEPLTPLTVDAAAAAFKAVVLPQLAGRGFRFRQDKYGIYFVRNAAVGEQLLRVALRDDPSGVELHVNAAIVPKLPPALAKAAPAADRLVIGVAPAALQPLDSHRINRHRALDPVHPDYAVGTPAELEAFMRAYAGVAEAHWLPLLEATTEAPGLLDAVRRGDRSSAFLDLNYLVLVLAHWTAAADQAGLEQQVLARFEGKASAQRVVREVAERLRNLPDCFGIYPRLEPS